MLFNRAVHVVFWHLTDIPPVLRMSAFGGIAGITFQRPDVG